MSKRVGIITGGSSGLGQEFVRELSAFCKDASERREGGAGITRPDELWVLARREDRLRELQRVTDIPVHPLPCDLTDKESILGLQALLDEERPEVVLLINAAGYGKIGLTEKLSLDDVEGMVDLNCRAAVAVTQVCLPYMEKGDRIIEIVSTSAFQPFTRLNVYAASKAFLLSYSRALAVELRPRGISVTAVCPYWIKDTEFIGRAEEGASAFEQDATTDADDNTYENRDDSPLSSLMSRMRESMHRSNNEDIHSYPLADRRQSVVRMALIDASIGLNVSTPGAICTMHRLIRHLLPTDLMIMMWEGLRRL